MLDSRERVAQGLADRYRIERELGRGGMSVVYLADDLKHHRRVAIKVLPPELASYSVANERFLQEIQIVSNLTHPHILPLHDSGEVDDAPYYVMPYVAGETLRDRLRRESRLPVTEALRLTRQVGDALAYAHAHGVVHRDIKPENILLEEGHAVVADFGIARALTLARTTDDAAPPHATGTPLYMSPEQATGRGPVDARSDLFSLGCVLYEMLTGKTPWTGVTPEEISARRLAEAPRSLRLERHGVPADVERAVRWLLALNPDDRPRSAEEFLQAWAMPPREEERRRKRIRTGARTGVLLALSAVAYWVTRPPFPPPDPLKVVVYPFDLKGDTAGHTGLGEMAATAVYASLENTQWLQAVEGWGYLEPEQRTNLASFGGSRARRLTSLHRARWYVDGQLVLRTDSVHVSLFLVDLVTDSTRSFAFARRLGEPVGSLGIAAANHLLPILIPPGRRVERLVLQDVAPQAETQWLLGEQAYKRARFDAAAAHFRAAVAADSSFAFAALRGAQASLWVLAYDSANALLGVALRRPAALTPRLRFFASGLRSYVRGDADSAVASLTHALAQATTWTDAREQLGHVYTHLLPRTGPQDSIATAAFERILREEPGYGPPLYHLIQDAARRGDARRVRSLTRDLERMKADSLEIAVGLLLRECLERRPEKVRWERYSARQVAEAAQVLTVGGLRQPACAEAAWRWQLATDSSLGYRYGAIRGLQAVLAGQRRTAALDSLLGRDDPVVAARYRLPYYVLSLFAGLSVDSAAAVYADTLRAMLRSDGLGPRTTWLLGLVEARAGHADTVEMLARRLQVKADSMRDPATQLLVRSLRAFAALARGDTSRAIAGLDSLAPASPKATLLWDYWRSLAPERLTLAQLLLARREFPRAIDVAQGFDSPASVTDAAFVPASLLVRRQAADSLQDRAASRAYAARLARLGW